MMEAADQGLPVYLVPGNHERSHIKVTLFEQHPKIFTFDRPRTLRLECRGISLSLSGFPFYRGNIRDSFSEIVEKTDHQKYPAEIKLLCMHQVVEVSQVGAQNYTFRDGPGVIRGTDIPGGFHAVLSGHIHRSQVLTHDLLGRPFKSPVIYPGAIARTSFAERKEEKGFYILSFMQRENDHHRFRFTYRFQPIPCRPMFDLVLKSSELDLPDASNRLKDRLHSLHPDGIVRISIKGDFSPASSRLLSMEKLRSLAPPTMNVSLNAAVYNKERFK